MAPAAEIVQLPYTSDLTFAGITYACKNLPRIPRNAPLSLFFRLQRMVMAAAIDLAFRRYLAEQSVPYRTVDVAYFTDPHRHDTLLGGRRVLLHTALLQDKPLIQQVRHNPGILTEAQGAVSLDELAAEDALDEDLFVFAFLTGLLAETPQATRRALSASQPAFILFPLDSEWASPPHWRPLGESVFKSEMDMPVALEIGGEDVDQNFVVDTLELLPRTRTPYKRNLTALTYLRLPVWPTARLGVHNPILDRTLIIAPPDWANIWVYGLEIYLAGYLSRGEFRRSSRRVGPDHPFFCQQRMGMDAYMVPVEQLHPLSDLLARAKNWAQQRLR